MNEYLRPWKLATLVVGIVLLIWGSFYYQAPDWDITISFIMAILTYLTASWSIGVIVERQWKYWPLMLFYTWFAVDGAYAIYWYLVDPWALEMMRDVNWPVSLPLYWICGLIWLYKGSLKEFWVRA